MAEELPDHGRIKEEVTCAVCLELFDHPLLLPCSHTFCKACLETMLAKSAPAPRPSLRCPQCQEEVLLPQGVGQLRKNNLAANIVASLTKSQADRPSAADDSTRKDANRSQRPSVQGQLEQLQSCLEQQQCAITDQQEKVQKDVDRIARQAEEKKRQVTDYFRKLTAQLQARERQLHQEVDASQVKATAGLQDHLTMLESRMADVISATDKVSDLIKTDVPSAGSSLHDEVDGVTKQTKEVCISLPEVAAEETEALDHLQLSEPSINNFCKLITLQAATTPQSTCESAQEREVKKKHRMPFYYVIPPTSMGNVTTYPHGQKTDLSAPYAPGFQARQQVPMGQPGASGQQGVVPARLNAPVTIRPQHRPPPHMPLAQPEGQVIPQGVPVGGPWPTHGYPISAPHPSGMASPHMPLAQPGAWVPPPVTPSGVWQPYHYPYLSTAQVGGQVVVQGLSAGGQQSITGQSSSVGAAVSSTMAQSAGQIPPQSASTGGQQPHFQASKYKFFTQMRNPSPVQVTQKPQPQSAMNSRPKVCASAEEVEQQEPLTVTILAAVSPVQQKEMLGERLFPLIKDMHGDLAGKITGMLLELDNFQLLHMLKSHESLKAKVEEAFAVLQAHSQKESAKQDAAVKTREGSAEGERSESSRKKKAKGKKLHQFSRK